MGIVSRLLADWGGPLDDRWWRPGNVVYLTDQTVSGPEAHLRVPTVWRAVNVLCGAVASLPLDVYQYIDPAKPELGKKVAINEPWRSKLRRSPNRIQTSFRWRTHMVGQVLLAGNYYAQKVAAPGQEAEQLYPLDPDRMKVVDVGPDGSLTYQYKTKTGKTMTWGQDEILHIRGFSRDGVCGVSVIDLMRETTQLALSNRVQRSTFVKNELRPSLSISYPGSFGDKGIENVQKGLAGAFGGPTKAGKVLVLENGASVTPFQITSRDAQYIESEHFLIEEFLRFIGVPGVLVGHADKTATYASAEQFFQSFVTHGVMPITSNIEEELTASLFPDSDDLFVEFNLTGMLQADHTARSNFYKIMAELGIFTRNEIRALENRNPLEGLDEPLTPVKAGGAPLPVEPESAPPETSLPKEPPAPKRGAAAEEPEDDHGLATGFRRREEEAARGRAERAAMIASMAASRVVRKEVSALQSLAKRYASDPVGWAAQLTMFYEKHGDLVAEALALEPAAAAAYCTRQKAEALTNLQAIEAWQGTRPAELVALALGAAPPPTTLVSVAAPVVTLNPAPITVEGAQVKVENLVAPSPVPVTVTPTVTPTPVTIEVAPSTAVIDSHVHVAAPAPAPVPDGPQEMRIVGVVDTRVLEVPDPLDKEVEVTARDPQGRIKRTTERSKR